MNSFNHRRPEIVRKLPCGVGLCAAQHPNGADARWPTAHAAHSATLDG